jgi:prolyl-tRNA synthetase
MAVPSQSFQEELPPKSDLSNWYVRVILRAELADYFEPVGGCMVIRPYGYTLWEHMQALLDARFKATGHSNAYFPLFVPESLLKKEAEHVEGFAPEVAWVTEAGNEPLAERLAIRPTSESIIGLMYSKWIQSWRDLPVLINLWNNVVRWEKRTRFFLRTTEFLWQEGHTAHRTEQDALDEVLRILDIYADFVENDLGIPVIKGYKSAVEKFAGAEKTYTIEALMPDGLALQSGTSHHLGQNFARAFNISFQDDDGQRKLVWTTSWGLSTRTIGALIMVHGDDSGLILPPHVAPIQLAILPVRDEPDIRDFVGQVEQALAGTVRLLTDWSDKRLGWKRSEWELRGVPLRLEVGSREVQEQRVDMVRRDDPGRTRYPVPLADIPRVVAETLETIQRDLLRRARAFLEANIRPAASFDEFKQIMETTRGFILAQWCGDPSCEAAIKAETGATIRCIPLSDLGNEPGQCVYDGRPSPRRVLFARAY